MKKNRQYFKTQYFLFILFWAPALCLWTVPGGVRAQTNTQVTTPAENNPKQAEVTGIEYVDIRHGFVLRPPLESIPLSTPPADLTSTKQDPCLAVPDLSSWQAIKIPPSQELVRFVQMHDKRQIILSVCLLVVKKQMNIEQMLQERSIFWKQYPQQATIKLEKTDIINNRQAALITVLWKGKGKAKATQILDEALIQNEKDRYFLLRLTAPNGSAETVTNAAQLSAAVRNSFNCLGKDEEDRRWEQARKQAQTLWQGIKPEHIQKLALGESWFRLRREDKEVGFLQITEKWVQETSRQQLAIDIQGYINNEQDGIVLAHLQGWQGVLPGGNVSAQMPAGPVSLTGREVLDGSRASEQFEHQLLSANGQSKQYRELGQWQDNNLIITRFHPDQKDDKGITEKLEVNPQGYLPQAAKVILPRLVERKPGREYVFMEYYNRVLCYYVLRVAAEETLTIGKEQVKTVYLIGQAGGQGPIIEIWLDEKGQIVQKRGGGLVLERSTAEAIKKIWPNQPGSGKK